LSDRRAWPTVSKASALVSIVAGLVSLGQFAWVAFSQLETAVPFWLLLTASASCFVCGWFFGIWLQNRLRLSGGSLRKLGQIRFDYLPNPPTKNGWRLEFDGNTPPEQRKAPEFTAAHPAPVPGSLSIRDNGRYSLNYTIEQIQSLANLVEYCVKPTRTGTLYLRVVLSSRDGSQKHPVWLRHVIGTPVPRRINPSEWSLDIQGELLEDGWMLVKVSLEDEVARTFGKEGLVYQSLQAVRLRGSLSISPMTLYRVESHEEGKQNMSVQATP